MVNLNDHKRLYARVLELFVDYPIDYVDGQSRGPPQNLNQAELFSFDTDFDGIPRLTRREP
jgi:hypothetical protein